MSILSDWAENAGAPEDIDFYPMNQPAYQEARALVRSLITQHDAEVAAMERGRVEALLDEHIGNAPISGLFHPLREKLEKAISGRAATNALEIVCPVPSCASDCGNPCAVDLDGLPLIHVDRIAQATEQVERSR